MNYLYFVSHSHWDREWYMSFEKHRFRLVEFFDRLLDTLDRNPDFKTFHLDGQAIILDDYLEIKPEMTDKVRKYVAEGRLEIGPFYILQDEFLISGEANVRNLLYGIKAARKYGPVCMVGYFPDAFGNISQTPQILRGFGIDCVAFGRGINPVGKNNTVIQSTVLKRYKSELKWRSPDGSEVLGVFFANWYNNATEVPAGRKEAVAYIKEIRNRAAASASTPYLLMMNGCDHQPVQIDLPQILKNAQPELPNDVLIQTGLTEYVDAIRSYSDNFDTVEGELTGQFTDGMMNLVNTASSRIYLKQMNHRAQTLLEKWAEPLGVMSWLCGDTYRSGFFNYAWKILMQNHPHDSICGCSIDDVHQEMEVRFKKSIAISEELVEREIRYLGASVNTAFIKENETAVVVFNPLNWKVTEPVTFFADFDEEEKGADNVSVYSLDGRRVAANVTKLGRTFTYTLPDDSFRKVKYVNRFKVTFTAQDVPGTGFKTYLFKREKQSASGTLQFGDNFAENEFLRLDISRDGSLTVTEKQSGKAYSGLNTFEDCGDCGNEYTFIQPETDKTQTTCGTAAEITVVDFGSSAVTFQIVNCLMLPEKYNKALGKRSGRKKAFRITSYVTLSEYGKRVDILAEFDNMISDHRLRALFPTGIHSDYCYADGQFDIVKRPVTPWSGWKNPSNCERQQAFVDVHDGTQGLVVANRGLPEYEILRDGRNTIALTLVRSIGELGDWGDFPTPKAQCHGPQKVEYSVIPCGGEPAMDSGYRQAYQFNLDGLKTALTGKHEGILDPEMAFLDIKGENTVTSAFKKCEDRESVILRVCHLGAKTGSLSVGLKKRFQSAYETNLNEQRQAELPVHEDRISIELLPKQISTIELVQG